MQTARSLVPTEIHVEGTPDLTTGWITDFADSKAAFQLTYDQLDHRDLNDIDGLSNPTSEHLAQWMWEPLKLSLPRTLKSRCTRNLHHRPHVPGR